MIPVRSIAEFQGSRVPGFQGSRVPGFESSRVPGFQGSSVSRFQGSRVPRFQGSRVWEFQGFRVPGFQGSRVSGFQASGISGFQGSRVPGFRFRILGSAVGRGTTPRPRDWNPTVILRLGIWNKDWFFRSRIEFVIKLNLVLKNKGYVLKTLDLEIQNFKPANTSFNLKSHCKTKGSDVESESSDLKIIGPIGNQTF